jgi:membrane-bound lytic murein transglycosylase D
MRFYSHPYRAVILSTALSAALGAILACQDAKKPTSSQPPPQAQAPALTAASLQPDPHRQKPAAEPQSKPPVPQAPEVDPVAGLIARVEKQNELGQDNTRAGNLEAAKQNFDSAFNLLLASGLDLHNDDRLEHELNRILDAINAFELAALQQSDAIAEPKSEPAPIDEANDLTPTVDKNVRAKAEAEIKFTHSDLPLMMTDQVAGYINYFSTRGRGTVERALARSGRYEDMIRRTFREQGVPQDLIYLAEAESGFHPLAVSRAGARGMWQFMGSRAKGYGLQRSYWVDDRQDPEKSTRAAAHHLKDLYNQFGDWYLAMAAYNSGPGTVQSAVKRTGYADFWELYNRNVLPKETRNYVPIILAVTIMAKNPGQYGLDAVVREKPVPYDTVKIDYAIDLRLVAECVDVTAEDLLDLNPSLLRLTTPKVTDNNKDRGFELHLPVGTADKFQTAVAAIPADKRVAWRYHKVLTGETLGSLSRAYGIPIKSIVAANHLDDRTLEPDSQIIIPFAVSRVSDSSTYARATIHYKVRPGDTVESVAENFGVSPKMLRGWNRIKNNSLAGKKVLFLHLPVTPGAEGKVAASKHPTPGHHLAATAAEPAAAGSATIQHHTVKPGDTLYSIAKSYKTTVEALERDNENVATLRPGMILVIRYGR